MGALKKIIILHGWTYSTKKWGEIINLLEEKGYQVDIPNIPGLTEPIDKPWTMEDYIKWLGAIINKQKTKVVLMGHSSGGRLSVTFTNKFPDKISHLILIDSAGIYHKNFTRKLKRFFFRNVAKIGKKLTRSETLRKLLYKIVGERDYFDANPVQRQTMLNLISQNLVDIFPNIKVPTLIIWGRNDKATPLEDGIFMHKQIKNSRFYIVENARHSPMFTNPEQVANKIVEFLK